MKMADLKTDRSKGDTPQDSSTLNSRKRGRDVEPKSPSNDNNNHKSTSNDDDNVVDSVSPISKKPVSFEVKNIGVALDKTTNSNPFLKKDSGNASSWNDLLDDGKEDNKKQDESSSKKSPIKSNIIKDDPKSSINNKSFNSVFGSGLPFAAPGISQSKLGTGFSGFGSWKKAASDEKKEKPENIDSTNVSNDSNNSSTNTPTSVTSAIKSFKSVFGSNYKTSTIGFGSISTTSSQPTSTLTTPILQTPKVNNIDNEDKSNNSSSTEPPEWMRRKSSFDAFGKKDDKSSFKEIISNIDKPKINEEKEEEGENDNSEENDGENENDTKEESNSSTQPHELANITTGEENDKTVFSSRAKLFVWDTEMEKTDKWRERGKGTIKVNVIDAKVESGNSNISDEDLKKKSRILFRTEKSLRLALNCPIFTHTNPRKVSEKFVEFLGVLPEEPTQIKKFLVHVPDSTTSSKLEDVLNTFVLSLCKEEK